MAKKLIMLAGAALAVALTPAATADVSATTGVSITRSAFVPKSVTVNAGDTVKWTNNDTANHQVVCQKCPFTSPVLKAGESYSYPFTKDGKYPITDALSGRLKGTVTVRPGVTLAASPTIVTYGGATTISGRASSNAAGEKIIILGKQCGANAFSTLTALTTAGGGKYSTSVRPTKNTAYQAKWKTATSTPVTVKVRPKMRLAKLASHKYRVRVRAEQSLAGKVAEFQRYATATRKWRKVRRVTLKAIGTVGSTQISGAKFRARVRARLKVRIIMRSAQTAPCYAAGRSNVILS